jgi:hypothetical protein
MAFVTLSSGMPACEVRRFCMPGDRLSGVHWRLQIVQFGVGLPHGTFPDGLTDVETGGRALSRWAIGTGLM